MIMEQLGLSSVRQQVIRETKVIREKMVSRVRQVLRVLRVPQE